MIREDSLLAKRIWWPLAAWLVLGQALHARALFGCALVFSGLLVSQLPLRALAGGLRTRLRRLPAA